MTPRICFAPSIRLAIRATGYILFENDEIMVYKLNTKRINSEHIIPPETLYHNGLVPDADETGEHWITEPLLLHGQKYRIKQIQYTNHQITSLDLTEITDKLSKYDISEQTGKLTNKSNSMEL